MNILETLAASIRKEVANKLSLLGMQRSGSGFGDWIRVRMLTSWLSNSFGNVTYNYFFYQLGVRMDSRWATSDSPIGGRARVNEIMHQVVCNLLYIE
jgi:hypothetical protein